FPVNRGSLSDTISIGSPNCRYHLSLNSFAMSGASIMKLIALIMVYEENRWIMTNMPLCCPDFGKGPMKSIAMWVNGCFGISSEWSSPVGGCVDCLFL